MEHATPATVREFVDTLRREQWREQKAERIRVTGDPDAPLVIPDGNPGVSSYEGVLREFFTDVLEADDAESLVELWLFALEMAYAGIEELDAERIGKLFDGGFGV